MSKAGIHAAVVRSLSGTGDDLVRRSWGSRASGPGGVSLLRRREHEAL